MMKAISDSFARLHEGEERLREKALCILAGNYHLRSHVVIIEHAMDLADIFRQLDTTDEDLRAIQLLGMRTFNAFASSLKLAFAGYSQNSALIMRDILETVFLLDLFRGDRTAIERWRIADRKARLREFSPIKLRESLDTRDGFTTMKRAQVYELFSELAAHPTMKSSWMMRPHKDGDALCGPFIEATTLEAVLSEMGKLAVQFGEMLDAFMPPHWLLGLQASQAFNRSKRNWIANFYPDALQMAGS